MAVGMGAGSSLRQITVVGSDAREKAGALNFSGDGPGAAGHRNLWVAPYLCFAPRGVAPRAAPATVMRCLVRRWPGLERPCRQQWVALGQRGHRGKETPRLKLVCQSLYCECVSFAILIKLPIENWCYTIERMNGLGVRASWRACRRLTVFGRCRRPYGHYQRRLALAVWNLLRRSFGRKFGLRRQIGENGLVAMVSASAQIVCQFRERFRRFGPPLCGTRLQHKRAIRSNWRRL
jgi:hypothetical protein